MFIIWSGPRELNPSDQLGRLVPEPIGQARMKVCRQRTTWTAAGSGSPAKGSTTSLAAVHSQGFLDIRVLRRFCRISGNAVAGWMALRHLLVALTRRYTGRQVVGCELVGADGTKIHQSCTRNPVMPPLRHSTRRHVTESRYSGCSAQSVDDLAVVHERHHSRLRSRMQHTILVR